MILTNKYNLPDVLIEALKNDPYDSGGADITTTSLINPPQMVNLKKKYQDVLEEDYSEMLWRLMGQCMHVILERASKKPSIVEKRYFSEVNGWKISGQVDLIDGSTLVDYKVSSVWTYIYGSRIDEWTKQANVNRWLAHMNGIKIDRLENYMILRDWIKSKAGTNNYPQIQFVRVPLRLWDIMEAEKYVYERVKIHQESEKYSDEELAMKLPCSDEERWWNEKRGEFIRCQEYCIASSKCQQFIGLRK